MSHRFPHREEHIDSSMIKVEVNLDDMQGEWLGYVMEKLFDLGANDVFYTPIYMKKNRPGVMLQLLCESQKLDEIKAFLFKETTTLGLRYYPISVHRLERAFYHVETALGTVTVKQGTHNGVVVENAPEYEECRAIAQEHHIPIKDVYGLVWEKIREEERKGH